MILLLKTLGIDDLVNFDYIDIPPKEILIRGLEQLYALGALNDEGELTKLGRDMSEFPIEPNLSKCIMMSVQYFCLDQILTIVSMISVGSSFFYKPRDKNEIGNSEKI
jgi:pre-mRNA-splicing factor ATP-dependent RNA helicase DHX16